MMLQLNHYKPALLYTQLAFLSLVLWVTQGLYEFVFATSPDLWLLLIPTSLADVAMRCVVIFIVALVWIVLNGMPNPERELRALYLQFFHPMPQALLLVDPQGLILELNAGAEKLFKTKVKEDMQGTSLHQISGTGQYADTEAADGLERLLSSLQHSQVTTGTFTCKRWDQQTFMGEVTISKMSMGHDFLMLVCVQDISAVDELKHQLARYEGSYFDLYQAAPIAMFTVDTEAVITRVNNACCEMFGYDRHELVGRDMFGLYATQDPSNVQRAAALFYKVWNKHSVEPVQMRMQGKDGHNIWCLTAIEQSSTLDNALRYSMIDFSEWVHAKEQLENERSRLLETNKKKREFLAAISHDLRTPLNTIIGVTDVLMHLPDKDEAQLRHIFDKLMLIEQAGERLNGIIDAVLDINRIEAGTVQHATAVFSLQHELDDLRALHQVTASQQQMELSVHIDPQLAEYVVGDIKHLRQIMDNLISNAIHHSAGKTIRIAAALHSQWSKADGCNWKSVFIGEETCPRIEPGDTERLCRCQWVVLSVCDDGVGMDGQILQDIFKPFWQESRGGGGSSGLGLAISKSMVEAMQGELWVDSALGEGSCFYVKLLLHVSQDVPVHITPAVHAAPTATASDVQDADVQDEGHLLIVDDDPGNIRLIKMYLENTPYTYDIAGNGKEALAACTQEEHAFDLVVMDLRMPEMSGDEATRRIRAYEKAHDLPHVNIMILTADAVPETLDAVLRDGADTWLTKPLKRDVFLRAISSMLHTHACAASAHQQPTVMDTTVMEEQGAHEPVHALTDQRMVEKTHHLHISDPMLLEILPEYIEEKLQDVAQILVALKQHDYETVYLLGHSMKGSGISYGLEQVSAYGKDIQAAAEDKNDERIKSNTEQLQHYLAGLEIMEGNDD